MKDHLPKFLWLWLPPAFIAAQLALEFVLPGRILGPMHQENGPHELLQFLVLLAAFIIALRTLIVPMSVWLRAWIGLAALCCLYVGGEEISWGQHVFDWATPEFWAQVNDQQETNLHNTSSWLDQKPKLLLEIGVFAGGLIIPLLLRYKPQWVPSRFNIIYPSAILSVTATIALCIMITHKFDQRSDVINIFTRANEVLELYLYYFVALYLAVLRRRILKK